QHERPAAEHLLGEELRQHAVAAFLVGADAEHVVGVAVQHERRGRAREIELRELRGPRGEPRRQIDRSRLRGVGRHCFSACRRSDSRIAGGSSSCSPRPVRCCSSLTAFSVWRMLSAAASAWELSKSVSGRCTASSASAWILPSMRSSSRLTNSAFFFARWKLSSLSSPIATLFCSDLVTRSSLGLLAGSALLERLA